MQISNLACVRQASGEPLEVIDTHSGRCNIAPVTTANYSFYVVCKDVLPCYENGILVLCSGSIVVV